MKKSISVFLSLVMVLSLAACSSGTATQTTAANETAAATEAQTTAEASTKAAETEASAKTEAATEAPAVEIVGEAAGNLPVDHVITLDSTQNSDGTWTHTATIDGEAVTEYDYTWNCDYTTDHDEVKNCPAEYYTGEKPGDDAGAVYIAHDIYYYPEIPDENFKLVFYDEDTEWAAYYPETSKYKDFIFGTLPIGTNFAGNTEATIPHDMMHSSEEAAGNAKLHITEPGSYSITGNWHGQIWIDLGDQDDTFTDENAKVTVYLNQVDVTCTVAPAIIFYSVYECDNGWEDREEKIMDMDTSAAGANVVIADGTVNNFKGTNVYRMLKAKLKKDDDTSEVPVQKKARKTDAAFYSYQTMNIGGGNDGTGILNITGGFEGLDTELHMTINGGNINIYSQDDGINVNEDFVSVLTINGGNVHILAGLGSEGDGVDSNGYLVINGGTVIAAASPASDSGLDADLGSFINGGTVLALGSTMDWAESESKAVTMNLRFSGRQSADEAIIVTETDGKVVFAYDPDKDEIASGNTRYYQGAVISCENFEVGKKYLVYVGGDVIGTETAGVYDAETVTGFTDEAIQQGYSGKDGFGFDGFDMGNPPEGFESGQPGRPGEGDGGRPEMPDNFNPSQRPEGFGGGRPGQGGERPEMPGNFDPSRFEGRAPADFDPSQFNGQMPGGFGEAETVDASELTTTFLMEDAVNSFSGVQDYIVR